MKHSCNAVYPHPAVVISETALGWLERLRFHPADAHAEAPYLVDCLLEDNDVPRLTVLRVIASYVRWALLQEQFATAVDALDPLACVGRDFRALVRRRREFICKRARLRNLHSPIDIIQGNDPPKARRDGRVRFVDVREHDGNRLRMRSVRVTHRVVVGCKWILRYAMNPPQKKGKVKGR